MLLDAEDEMKLRPGFKLRGRQGEVASENTGKRLGSKREGGAVTGMQTRSQRL